MDKDMELPWDIDLGMACIHGDPSGSTGHLSVGSVVKRIAGRRVVGQGRHGSAARRAHAECNGLAVAAPWGDGNGWNGNGY